MSQEPQGCLPRLLALLFGRREQGSPAHRNQLPRVQVNKYFFSDAETNFYRVLQTVVAGRAVILAQVSLKQLLWFPGNSQSNPGRGTWQNKINARSLDFVLCNPTTLRPLVAIELDDATHATPKRQTRDDEVELLLEAAGLKLLHVLASRTYDTRELSAAIVPHLPSFKKA